MSKGLSLIELITAIAILAIFISLAVPSFSRQINLTHTRTAATDLYEAIQLARSTAVTSGKRVTVAVKKTEWIEGWVVFIDENNNGRPDIDERELKQFSEIESRITIKTTHRPMKSYISFISTGEGRQIGRANAGALLMGTINVCSTAEKEGFALVLSRGGRTRVQPIKEEECTKT